MTSSFFIVAKGNTADLDPKGIATVAKSLEIFVKKIYKTQNIAFFFFTIIQRILNKRSSYLAGYVEHIFRFTPKLIQVLYNTWANKRKTKMRLFCFHETTFVIFLATSSTQLRFASIFYHEDNLNICTYYIVKYRLVIHKIYRKKDTVGLVSGFFTLHFYHVLCLMA